MNATEDEDPPWTRPGEFRRDGEPHRGPFLLGLATSTCVLACGSGCCLPLGVVSLVLGIAVLTLVQRDRASIDRGEMDPDGLEDLEFAGYDARCAILLSLVGLVFFGSAWLDFFGRWSPFDLFPPS